MYNKKNTVFSPIRRGVLRTGSTLAACAWAGGLSPLLRAQDRRAATLSATAETRYGRVRGLRLPDQTSAYYGIPYAATTAGAGRFKAPSPPTAWSGVRDCMEVGNRPPQTLEGPISEVHALDRQEPLGEDCLNLNVFTPSPDGARRPVLVWLHGGGFTSGSGNWLLYDGRRLARGQEVVVVSVTHRLNVFGHLHLAELGGEEYADSGNAGMLDIVAALEWVRDNIQAFGGDPDNVTLFGQSGGGGKVSTLLAMPAARGLFHKAIAMSGAALDGIPAARATETAERYLAALQLDRGSLARLHELPMERLLAAYLETPGLGMGPVVDGRQLPVGPFTPAAPELAAGIPMMLGTTEHEVNFLPNTPLDAIEDAMLFDLVTRGVAGGDERRARELIGVYRQGRPDTPNVELYQVMASDSTFRRGVLVQADLKSAQDAPVWLYYFRWNSAVRGGRLRAYHCLDIPFAFDNVDVCASMTGGGQDRYALAGAMSGAFAAFARSGDPNHDGLPRWPRFDTESRATMLMDSVVEAVNDPFGEERRALYGQG